jgi:hypothetical protein
MGFSIMKQIFCTSVLTGLLMLPLPAVAGKLQATLYKDPQCGCCEGYVAYLRNNGFEVDVIPSTERAQMSLKAGVPEQFQGCHTMFVNGYVVDGHVPIGTVRKLLAEKPDISGIALPGMPLGSSA